MKRFLIVGLLALGSCGLVAVHAVTDSALKSNKGAQAVAVAQTALDDVARDNEADFTQFRLKLLDDPNYSPEDFDRKVEEERNRRIVVGVAPQIWKGRRNAADQMAQGYLDTAGAKTDTQKIVSNELADFHLSKPMAGGAAQVSQLAQESALHLQALQVAQNQRLIEQNEEILLQLRKLNTAKK